MKENNSTGKNEIVKLLKEHPNYREKLFCRGFIVTDDETLDLRSYPFYGVWEEKRFGRHRVISHPQENVAYENAYCMIGHAFNPIRGIKDEKELLQVIAEAKNQNDVYDFINELTGVFILLKFEEKGLKFLADPIGLQSVFYSYNGENYYISSHCNLIGDFLNLQTDSYIDELRKTKYFKLFGNQLPGNLTQFSKVKRYVPNHVVCIDAGVTERRFYWPHSLNLDKSEVESKLIEVLCATMEMIPKKWRKPAISLTGGCDSKTTLACAVNEKSKYLYFSYDSQENEKSDAEAASKICKALGLDHILYAIPYSDDEISDIDIVRDIISWNCGNIVPNNKNDVRKRAFLAAEEDFDIEVKSWASEIGRSRYTKRYAGRKKFGETPSPRACTTFYKFLFFNRHLVNKTDEIFEEYLDKYFEADKLSPIPWQDQFYWEWHWSSRDGITLTGEQKYSNDITVPYNNRKILELLLSMPEDDRINDAVYSSIRSRLCPQIDASCRNVVDVNHTPIRAKLENLYYFVNTHLPY